MEPEIVTEPTSSKSTEQPPESPSLRAELESWKQQRQLLQESIAELEKPEPQAALAGNDFTRVLLKRFEQQDSAEERQKSIALAKTLMAEVQSKIEQREKYLKQVGDRIRLHRNVMSEAMRQINHLSHQLSAQLTLLKETALRAEPDWKISDPRSKPLIEQAEIVLPQVKPLHNGEPDFAICRFEEPIAANGQAPRANLA